MRRGYFREVYFFTGDSQECVTWGELYLKIPYNECYTGNFSSYNFVLEWIRSLPARWSEEWVFIFSLSLSNHDISTWRNEVSSPFACLSRFFFLFLDFIHGNTFPIIRNPRRKFGRTVSRLMGRYLDVEVKGWATWNPRGEDTKGEKIRKQSRGSEMNRMKH